jgi:hypothetical protein
VADFAAADAPTANPASAAPFFRNSLRLGFLGFMRASPFNFKEMVSHAQVGQASACLLLTFLAAAKFKTRQAEACPT